MKKYNPHSNRTRSRLVPAPKSQKPLIVAAGTIRAGTVFNFISFPCKDYVFFACDLLGMLHFYKSYCRYCSLILNLFHEHLLCVC